MHTSHILYSTHVRSITSPHQQPNAQYSTPLLSNASHCQATRLVQLAQCVLATPCRASHSICMQPSSGTLILPIVLATTKQPQCALQVPSSAGGTPITPKQSLRLLQSHHCRQSTQCPDQSRCIQSTCMCHDRCTKRQHCIE